MAQHFHQLKVKNVEREATDAICVEFGLNDEEKELFAYEAGQHITIRATIDGEELRRNYSICTAPSEGRLQIGIKQVQGGRFSTWANHELAAGTYVEVMPPGGRFTLHGEAAKAISYVFVAAGSGITPVLSLITTVLSSRPEANCTLIYANRNRSSIMFRERLEALKNRYMQRFQLIHLLSREATDSPTNHGRLTAEKCAAVFGHIAPLGPAIQYFLCGPLALVQTVKAFLIEHGVPDNHIHAELFTPTGLTNTAIAQKAVLPNAAASPSTTLQYILDGVSATATVPQEGLSLLDAVRLAGADAPYACKGGVCCTCKAKLLKGEVSMDVVYGLEPDEIAAGYILTCQAHPITPEVVISYDE